MVEGKPSPGVTLSGIGRGLAICWEVFHVVSGGFLLRLAAGFPKKMTDLAVTVLDAKCTKWL